MITTHILIFGRVKIKRKYRQNHYIHNCLKGEHEQIYKYKWKVSICKILRVILIENLNIVYL